MASRAALWMNSGPDLGPFGIYFWPVFHHFFRPEFGRELEVDFSVILDMLTVVKSQKYVRLFAKSEKSHDSNLTRFLIKFRCRFGTFFQ